MDKIKHVSFCKLTTIFPSSEYSLPIKIRVLNQIQESVLNYFYITKPYPTYVEREMMANMLGIKNWEVNMWFVNERYRNKNTSKNKNSSKTQSTHILSGKMLQLQCVHVEKLYTYFIGNSTD